ncbi:FtsX-like permease family protein, partial [Acinetobacter baumannii]
MFGTIFGFIAVIMGVIVLFTIANTMSMSVMERINEIGTLRALGQRRSGVRRQFLAEGFLLGLFGATLGV